MTDVDFLYLNAHGRSHTGAAAEFVASVKAYLIALALLDPMLGTVTAVTSSPRLQPQVRPADASFEEIVLPLLYHSKDVYEDLGPKHRVLPETRSKWGFSLMFVAGKWRKDGTMVHVNGHNAMQRVRCDVHVEFPVEGDPARRSPEFAAKVLRLTIESWKPYGAALTSSRFSRAVGGSDVLGVGWQTYFTDPRVVSIVPPGTACEPFADGVLMRLDGDTFSCSTGQVLQATVIRDALRPAGLLSLPPLDLAR